MILKISCTNLSDPGDQNINAMSCDHTPQNQGSYF